jgi:hypothetical protein
MGCANGLCRYPEVLSTRECGADSANQRMKNYFYQIE